MVEAVFVRGGLPSEPFMPGTDPVFWLVPSDQNPFFGWLTTDFYARYRHYHNVGFVTWVGVATLVLACLALASKRLVGGRRRFWLSWVGVFFVLSLGPALNLLGEIHQSVPLPLALFEHVRLLHPLHVGNRFVPFVMLGLAVLVGFGMRHLLDAGRARVAWSLAALVAVEYAWLPYPTQPVAFHPALDAIARAEGPGAVLPVPLPVGAMHARALYDQTRHGRPVPGGYVSYRPKSLLQPILTDGFLSLAVGREPGSLPIEAERLAGLGVRWVVVHQDRRRSRYRERMAQENGYYARRRWQPNRAQTDEKIDRALAFAREKLGPPVVEDDDIVVFEVPGWSDVGPRPTSARSRR
jgi:hypothetical protein